MQTVDLIRNVPILLVLLMSIHQPVLAGEADVLDVDVSCKGICHSTNVSLTKLARMDRADYL